MYTLLGNSMSADGAPFRKLNDSIVDSGRSTNAIWY
jgi:hypothetical protein